MDYDYDYISLLKEQLKICMISQCFHQAHLQPAAELLTVLAMSLDYSVLRPNDGGDPLGRSGSCESKGPTPPNATRTPGNSWSYQGLVKILS